MRDRSLVTLALAGLALSIGAADVTADDLITQIGYVHYQPPGSSKYPEGYFFSLTPEKEGEHLLRTVYLLGSDFGRYVGSYCEAVGIFARGPVGGSEQDYYILTVERIDIVPEAELIEPILEDLAARGVDFFEDGTEEPEGGLQPDGKLPDGSRTVMILLDIPFGADVYYTDAIVCPGLDSYWAKKSGGFAGDVFWVGPFELPASDLTPDRVRPERLRLRDRPRRKTLKLRLRRGKLTRYLRESLSPEDFDLGEGVTVLRVRAKAKCIRLRVELAPDAATGPRDVAVRENVGEDLLELRPRRSRR